MFSITADQGEIFYTSNIILEKMSKLYVSTSKSGIVREECTTKEKNSPI